MTIASSMSAATLAQVAHISEPTARRCIDIFEQHAA
jgi:hypothetical protein